MAEIELSIRGTKTTVSCTINGTPAEREKVLKDKEDIGHKVEALLKDVGESIVRGYGVTYYFDRPTWYEVAMGRIGLQPRLYLYKINKPIKVKVEV